MSTHANLLPEYLRLRQAGKQLNHKMIKSLSTEALRAGGRTLGILKGDTFVFDSEDETSVLMDYCLYNVYSDGKNAVQRYLADSPPPANSDELIVLQASQSAYYSLVLITGVERGVGVAVRDVLRGDESFLVDVGLGTSAREGDIVAGRVIPLQGFLITGGASLPMNREAATRIKDKLQRIDPATDFSRLAPDEEAELAAMVIRTCLRSGAASQINYETPGSSGSRGKPAGPGFQPVRANRNDPCPCGSGRKYKSCCRKRSA